MTTTPTPAELAMARAILAVLHPEWDEDNCDTVERNKGPSWQRAVRCARAAEKARLVGDQAAITDIIRRAMLERPGSSVSFDRIAEGYVREITFLARPVGEGDTLLAEAEAALGLGDTDRACHTIIRRLMDRLRSARPVGEVPEGWGGRVSPSFATS